MSTFVTPHDPRRGEYAAKLRDPRWQKLRLQVFERDKWTCQNCFGSESTLHVHHRFYEKGREPWDYAPDALTTLCEGCHNVETETRYDNEKLLLRALRAKGFLSGDILSFAVGFDEMALPHLPEVTATALLWAFQRPEVMRTLLDKYFEQLKDPNSQSSASEA